MYTRAALVLVLFVAGVTTASAQQSARRTFQRSSYGIDGRAVAQVTLAGDTAVEVRAGGSSVQIDPTTFYAFAEDFVAYADSLEQGRVTIGMRGRNVNVVLDHAASVVGVVAAVLVGFAVAAVLWRRARRRRRARREEYARTARARRQLEEGREEERRRLARDLHDGALQALYALRLNLARRDPDLRAQDAAIERIAEHLREVTAALRAPSLAAFGVEASLRELASAHPAQAFDFAIDPAAAGALGEAEGVALYRVAQEAISNAVRHGGAGRIQFVLTRTVTATRFTVRDDGSGFNADALREGAEPGHYGLLGMNERVEALGGRVRVESERGRGTTIDVELPVGQDDVAYTEA